MDVYYHTISYMDTNISRQYYTTMSTSVHRCASFCSGASNERFPFGFANNSIFYFGFHPLLLDKSPRFGWQKKMILERYQPFKTRFHTDLLKSGREYIAKSNNINSIPFDIKNVCGGVSRRCGKYFPLILSIYSLIFAI